LRRKNPLNSTSLKISGFTCGFGGCGGGEGGGGFLEPGRKKGLGATLPTKKEVKRRRKEMTNINFGTSKISQISIL
jgi:hypothetical protein